MLSEGLRRNAQGPLIIFFTHSTDSTSITSKTHFHKDIWTGVLQTPGYSSLAKVIYKMNNHTTLKIITDPMTAPESLRDDPDHRSPVPD